MWNFFKALCSLLLVTVVTFALLTLKINSKVTQLSFKKQVEISLVNLMQLDPKSKSIKIGSIENSIFTNTLKIKNTSILDAENKVYLSAKEIELNYNPIRALFSPNFMVEYKIKVDPQTSIEGKAILKKLSKSYMVVKSKTKVKSLALEKALLLNFASAKPWKWQSSWSGMVDGILSYTHKDKQWNLKAKIKKPHLKINARLSKTVSPRLPRKIYKAKFSKLDLEWKNGEFKTNKPVRMDIAKLKTRISANTISQTDFPAHSLWQVELNSPQKWNIVFSHLMGCYPKSPTKRYVILNGPNAHYCKKLNDVASRKRRQHKIRK